jgi:hypothetical protein
MKDLTLSIEINRSAADICAFTLDPANTPKWVDFIAEEETNEWPPKVGTIYRNRGLDDAELFELELTVYEPGKTFTLSKTDGSYSVRYTFIPLAADRTKFEYYEWTDEAELSVPFAMAPLQKLKSIMESEAA